MITLEKLFEWDEVACKKKKEENGPKRKRKKKIKVDVVEKVHEERDKTQDKLELALEDNPDEVRCDLIDTWKPCVLEGYETPEFKIPINNSNNSLTRTREELSRVLAFIEYAQRKRIKGGCTAMPIPTTSRKNLTIWGYPKAISRGIEFMKELGLITVYIDQFRFGVPFEGANYGRNVLSEIYKMKIDMPGVEKAEIDELMGRLREAAFKALGSRTFGSDIFYIESCVYLMTLYDLLTSGHMVWLVYDAFYSNGEEDQELFETMVRNAVRMNFGYFMERSDFRQFSKTGAIVEEICNKNISIKDILNKYNIDTLVDK